MTTCSLCGKRCEQEARAADGKALCPDCAQTQTEYQTVACATVPAGQSRDTVSMGTEEERTQAVGSDVGSSDRHANDKTCALALEGQQDQTQALAGAADQASAAGADPSRSASFFSLNRSAAATRVIREILKIKPDVDLEHASQIYSTRKGRAQGDTSAATISELISRADEERKYIVDRELGRGGMGAVFATVDQDIRRKVAMKVMLPSASGDARHIKRFLEEAQVTGQLEHPNIVPVHEIGINDQSKVYFTMKLVKGETLESIISRISSGDQQYRQKYGLGTLLQLFMKVCDGMGYAHAKGVLHRDLKPENIMVGDFGEVLVMDWGLSKVMGREDVHAGSQPSPDQEQAPAMHTLEGQVMGTPGYMSPEQAQGQVSELDERSDLFSLGAILYKILTFQTPYRGKTAREVLDKARKRLLDPPDLRAPENSIPPELTAICMKAMARAKIDRYADAGALKADLQLYLDGKSVSARRDSLLVMAKKWIIRNKVAAMGIAAALLCLALGIGSAALFAEKKRQARVADLLAQARQAQDAGDFEAAEEHFFAVLGLDRHNSQARSGIALVSGKALAIKNRRLAQEKLAEARQLFESGQFSKAYDAYVAVFALDPESADAREAIRVAALKAEQQKAQEKSRPILSAATRLQDRQAEIEQQVKQLQDKIKQISSRIRGHEDFAHKKPLWDKEQELLAANIERLKTEGQIISSYSTVLSYDGTNAEARRALAGIYYEKLLQAEQLHQHEEMAYFRELMLAFDDGAYQAMLQQDGLLSIATEPAADGYALFRFIEGPDRRLLPVPCEPGAANARPPSGPAAFEPLSRQLQAPAPATLKQIAKLRLPYGSYLVIARKRGFLDVRIPAVISRGAETALPRIRLLPIASAPAGLVYVPAGPFIMGGDPQAPYAQERTQRTVPGFLIGRTEVTVAEYLQFINDLEAALPGSAEKYLPRTAADGGFYWKKAGNQYQADFPPEWPVLGISWDDARAYCAWLTRRHADKAWRFRLPEEWEWEKAGRGVDGRSFPWGNCFDYRFCSMANSKAGKRSGPDPVGSFPLDESVYGIMDIAGNVAEWCQTFFDQEKNIRITRGAAWSYADAQHARCAGRNGHSPADVADFRGFRVALSLED